MKWINFPIKIDHLILNNKVIEHTLDTFFNKIMSKLSDKTYVMLLFRMEYKQDIILTLGPQQKINKYDTSELLKSYISLLELKDAQYKNTSMTNIILSYKIIPEDKLVMKQSRIHMPTLKKLTFHTFFGYNLPLTTDLKRWGDIISLLSARFLHHPPLKGKGSEQTLWGVTTKTMLIKKPNSNLTYLVYITAWRSWVHSRPHPTGERGGEGGGWKHHVVIMKNNQIILEFEDIIPNKQIPDTFTRKILGKGQEYHFKNGQLIVKFLDKATSFLKAIKVNKQINNKIITMDIESRKINNVSTPYLIAFFDGFKSYSFYLGNYTNVESMLKAAFTHLLKSKFDQHKIYLHNLSFFDGVFMLNILKALPDCQLFALRHEGKFINLQLSYGKKYLF